MFMHWRKSEATLFSFTKITIIYFNSNSKTLDLSNRFHHYRNDFRNCDGGFHESGSDILEEKGVVITVSLI
jgi:hypothetical protein